MLVQSPDRLRGRLCNLGLARHRYVFPLLASVGRLYRCFEFRCNLPGRCWVLFQLDDQLRQAGRHISRGPSTLLPPPHTTFQIILRDRGAAGPGWSLLSVEPMGTGMNLPPRADDGTVVRAEARVFLLVWTDNKKKGGARASSSCR